MKMKDLLLLFFFISKTGVVCPLLSFNLILAAWNEFPPDICLLCGRATRLQSFVSEEFFVPEARLLGA